MRSPLHRRGITLLFFVGMITICSMAVVTVFHSTAVRYGHAQHSRDRLQALECAQAGLLWARARLEAGDGVDSPSTLTFGDIGTVRISVAATAAGLRVEALGVALRAGELQASRRLEVLWSQEALP